MSTTLDILVRAQDQATKTINGVAASGKRLGTTLETSGKQGSTAMASVASTGSRVSSSMKRVAATVGIAFGVTAIYRFGKAAQEAFDDVQQKQRELAYGLEQIGQSGQFTGLVSDLDSVSNETLMLQGATDDVATSILNAGHNFFEALGPKAAGAVAGLTKGIINISAATHKSISMLQRSFTLAVVNTPEKAISMLAKYGIATDEQVTHMEKLAAAGDMEALQLEEVNRITNAYPGAAANAADESEKLAKAMDDIKIKLGKVLDPIVTVLAYVADWAAKNTALVATILGGAGLVYGLKKLAQGVKAVAEAGVWLGRSLKGIAVGAVSAVVGVAGYVTALVGLIATEGLAAVATMELGAAMTLLGGGPVLIALGAALAAGLAIGTMLDKVFGISEKLSNLIIDNSMNTSAAVEEQSKAYVDLTQSWRDGEITAEEFSTKIDALNAQYDTNISAAGIMAMKTTDVGTAVERTSKKVSKFAGMGQKAFTKWAHALKVDARSSITSLGGVELATTKTAHAFLKASNLMAKVARQDARAMRKLASESQAWVPDKYVTWLTEQGPGAVANFEKLTTHQQEQAVKDWKASARGADQYSSAINKLSPKSIDTARAAADRLNDSLDTMRNKSPINIDIVINKRTVNRARGGIVGADELTMVGEHGPELVALPGGSRVYPHGTGPRSGLAVSGGRDVTAGGGRQDIHVFLDRRRFVDAADYDVAYRGW